MQQTDGTNTLKFSYSPDGKALGVIFNGTSYYYIYNLQGDVIGLYDSSGNVVVEYTYDSWGKLLDTTGSLASTLGYYNPFRYRGYIYDEETGFYWLRSRYYDPEICRFINADGYVSTATGLCGYNMFSYCNSNPVCFCDSDGCRLVDSLSVQSETSSQRRAFCAYERQQREDTRENTLDILVNQTKIEPNKENTEIIASLHLENNPYIQLFNIKYYAKKYSQQINERINEYVIENNFSYEVMSVEHIYSELLVHYHIYLCFERNPTYKNNRIGNYFYEKVRYADINHNEKRIRGLMWLELIDY